MPALASAAYNSLGDSKFEIDSEANLLVDNTGQQDAAGLPDAADWQTVHGDTKTGVEGASGSGDNSFGQGTKEDTAAPSVVSGGIPPNKSDLKTFGTYLETAPNGKKYLHLFWLRVQDPTGSTNMDFEFNQSNLLSSNGTTMRRTANDLLIQYDLSNGGTKPTMWLSKWLEGPGDVTCEASTKYPCWGKRVSLTDSGLAAASINTTAIADAASAGLGAMSARTFGEATVDFSTITGGGCTSFGSAYLKSRSSDAFTAALKDFIAPVATSITNCGGITIEKVTEGGSGTFGFTSTNLDPASWNLTTTGSGEAFKDSRTFTGVLAGTYDVAETAQPGWTTSATCDDGSLVNAIDLSAGENVTCTFTNTANATLIVAKETLPDGSAEPFTFTQTSGFGSGDDGTFDLTDGTDTGTIFSDILPGTYLVTEAVPTGWKSSPSIVCTGDAGTENLSSGVGAVATFDLQPGEVVTCTYTNAQLAKVTVTKTDDDNAPNPVNGAVLSVYEDLSPNSMSEPETEDLEATAVASCTTAAGTCSTANVLDPTKAYWVVETTTPAGYTTADPQRIIPSAGDVALTFVDKREFTVITIICRNGSSPSLYQSSVTLDGVTRQSLSAAPVGGSTAAELCGLGGATFSPKHHGDHTGSVTIPQ